MVRWHDKAPAIRDRDGGDTCARLRFEDRQARHADEELEAHRDNSRAVPASACGCVRRIHAAAVLQLVEQLTPVLAPHSPEIRCAVLADLLALVLAAMQGERKHAERREALR